MKEFIESKLDFYDSMYGFDKGFLSAIVQIESSFNPDALGDGGRSFGLMQIMRGGALSDYEKQKGVTISDKQAFDIDTNLKIGTWYLGERIPEFLSRYGHDHTIENVVIAYNAGIGNLNKGIVPAGTKHYLKKVGDLMGSPISNKAAITPLVNDANFKPLLLALIPVLLKRLFG